MSKFKVGDKVRRSDGFYSLTAQKYGLTSETVAIVTGVSGSYLNLSEFPTAVDFPFFDGNFEMVNRRQTFEVGDVVRRKLGHQDHLSPYSDGSLVRVESISGYWNDLTFEKIRDHEDHRTERWADFYELVEDAEYPHDNVNHPSHYTAHPSGVECITITEAFNFNVGNAIKYLWRAGLKTEDATEDLQKAKWYVEREIERVSNGTR